MSITSQKPSDLSGTFGKDASFKFEEVMGSMSISPSGRDVVLGNKDGLQIIDLDNPYSIPRHLSHKTSWDVADVQWSPFAERDYWVISTSNQKALVWNLAMSNGSQSSIEFVLERHTRAITDINFSAYHPDVLATCAVDTYVHCWDLRTPSRPVLSFADWFAGATQVKWSRQDENTLASSHDRDLHIWDKRKGAVPWRTIRAHNTKVYGVDWNRFEPNKIVTCSLDKSIKFWNTYNDHDEPDRVIKTTFPVWRARHTPFGWGLTVMPQRGNGDLYLYDRRATDGRLESGAVKPAHVFPGHRGQVKEFLWRAQGAVKDGVDHRDFQLISWGTDRELKLQRISTTIFEDVGYERGVSQPQRLRFTRRGARYRTFRDEPVVADSPFFTIGHNEPFSHHARTSTRLGTTAGINRLSLSQIRQRNRHGQIDRRAGMAGRRNVRVEADALSWMRSVKISSWSTDSLVDEITQVGQNFPKIKFENVDVGVRKVTVLLQRPCLANKDIEHIRLELSFPHAYPKSAPAFVTMHKPSTWTAEEHANFERDLRKIAREYQKESRESVEAMTRYTIHDQSLEQLLSALKRSHPSNNDHNSDDSDDDGLLGKIPTLPPLTGNVNVPLTKGCAALWANDGRLVCFFKQKTQIELSNSSIIENDGLLREQDNDLFGQFGVIWARSLLNGTESSLLDEVNDHEVDMGGSISALSETLGPENLSLSQDLRTSTISDQKLGRPASEADSRPRESTRGNLSVSGDKFCDTTVVIHSFDDLVPSCKSAAEQYQLIDPTSLTLEHNARVASSLGIHDAYTAWTFLPGILGLQDESTMSISNPPGVHTSFKLSPQQDMKGNIDNANRSDIKNLYNRSGDVYIREALFGHLEQKADIQTLGCLSVILMQSSSVLNQAFQKLHRFSHRVYVGAVSNHAGPHTLSSVKSTVDNTKVDSGISHRVRSSIFLSSSLPQLHKNPFLTLSSEGDLHTLTVQPEALSIDSMTSEPTRKLPACLLDKHTAQKNTGSENVIPVPLSDPYLPGISSSNESHSSLFDSENSAKHGNYRSLHTNSSSAERMFNISLDNTSTLPANFASAQQRVSPQRLSSLASGMKADRRSSKRKTRETRGQKRKLSTRYKTEPGVDDVHDWNSALNEIEMCLKYVSYARQYCDQLEAWQLHETRSKLLDVCSEWSSAIDELLKPFLTVKLELTNQDVPTGRHTSETIGSDADELPQHFGRAKSGRSFHRDQRVHSMTTAEGAKAIAALLKSQRRESHNALAKSTLSGSETPRIHARHAVDRSGGIVDQAVGIHELASGLADRSSSLPLGRRRSVSTIRQGPTR